MAVFIRFNAHWCVHGQQFNTFGNSAFNFFRQSGHVFLTAAIDAGDLFGAKTNGRTGDVHGNVAAADDDHVFTDKIWIDVVANLMQDFYGAVYAVAFFAFDAGFLIGMRADGDVDAVERGVKRSK